ncbi:hypothetical protein CAMRE0001_1792 [Campylobacter rectus RM3267]|uniref:Uncharacterized protein n=1 Tax=Campylobacter rectus RM3267 TaxID=553218 RepID=B9CYH1_CAMRE|nr:hypothetical protein CAMRE0001_1792 [Campylobacter rectus RM3267]
MVFACHFRPKFILPSVFMLKFCLNLGDYTQKEVKFYAKMRQI